MPPELAHRFRICWAIALDRSPVIYVDVDDTLVRSFGSKRIPIGAMVARVRDLFEAGATLYCWSSGGADYARGSAQELGIEDCFVTFLPKPHLLIDDVEVARWRMSSLHPNEAISRTAAEILLPLAR
jgi:hypothetical protein